VSAAICGAIFRPDPVVCPSMTSSVVAPVHATDRNVTPSSAAAFPGYASVVRPQPSPVNGDVQVGAAALESPSAM